VWRRSAAGEVEVLLVHRPRYDDWTLPKGKCTGGEDDLACALREVEEETGLRCEPGPELASSSYRDSKGRPKTVRYWAMTPPDGALTPTDGALTPNDEVDEMVWLSLEAATDTLTYRRDDEVLASLARVY
jgi:8-oxo-dGTP diphosphatase